MAKSKYEYAQEIIDKNEKKLEKFLNKANFSEHDLAKLLIYAVEKGKSESVKTLLRKGADPSYEILMVEEEKEFKDGHKRIVQHFESPVAAAMWVNNLEYLKWFLEGFDPHVETKKARMCNQQGVSLLHIAAGFHNEKVCQYLIEQHADVNALTQQGKTPLVFLLEELNSAEEKEKIIPDVISIIYLFWEHGAGKTLNHFFETTHGIRNAFDYAYYYQHTAIVALFLEYERLLAAEHSQSKPGTSSHASLQSECTAWNEMIYTGLRSQNNNFALLLLEHGMDPGLPVTFARTERAEIDPAYNAMLFAISQGNVRQCRWYLHGVPGVETKTIENDFAGCGSYLHYILLNEELKEEKTLELIKLFCESLPGISLDSLYSQKKSDAYGKTPLVLAITKSFWKVVDYLLERDAKPDVSNQLFSALVEAVKKNNFDLCQRLISLGANKYYISLINTPHLPEETLSYSLLSFNNEYDLRIIDLFFDLSNRKHLSCLIHTFFIKDSVKLLDYLIDKYRKEKNSLDGFQVLIENALGVCIFDAPQVMNRLKELIPSIAASTVLNAHALPSPHEIRSSLISGMSEDKIEKRRDDVIANFHFLGFFKKEKPEKFFVPLKRFLCDVLSAPVQIFDELFYLYFRGQEVLTKQFGFPDGFLSYRSFDEAMENDGAMVRRFFDPENPVHVKKLIDQMIDEQKIWNALILVETAPRFPKEMLEDIPKTSPFYRFMQRYSEVQDSLRSSIATAHLRETLLLKEATLNNETDKILSYLDKGFRVGIEVLEIALEIANKKVIEAMLCMMCTYCQPKFNLRDLMGRIGARRVSVANESEEAWIKTKNEIARLLTQFNLLLYKSNQPVLTETTSKKLVQKPSEKSLSLLREIAVESERKMQQERDEQMRLKKEKEQKRDEIKVKKEAERLAKVPQERERHLQKSKQTTEAVPINIVETKTEMSMGKTYDKAVEIMKKDNKEKLLKHLNRRPLNVFEFLVLLLLARNFQKKASLTVLEGHQFFKSTLFKNGFLSEEGEAEIRTTLYNEGVSELFALNMPAFKFLAEIVLNFIPNRRSYLDRWLHLAEMALIKKPNDPGLTEFIQYLFKNGAERLPLPTQPSTSAQANEEASYSQACEFIKANDIENLRVLLNKNGFLKLLAIKRLGNSLFTLALEQKVRNPELIKLLLDPPAESSELDLKEKIKNQNLEDALTQICEKNDLGLLRIIEGMKFPLDYSEMHRRAKLHNAELVMRYLATKKSETKPVSILELRESKEAMKDLAEESEKRLREELKAKQEERENELKKERAQQEQRKKEKEEAIRKEEVRQKEIAESKMIKKEKSLERRLKTLHDENEKLTKEIIALKTELQKKIEELEKEKESISRVKAGFFANRAATEKRDFTTLTDKLLNVGDIEAWLGLMDDPVAASNDMLYEALKKIACKLRKDATLQWTSRLLDPLFKILLEVLLNHRKCSVYELLEKSSKEQEPYLFSKLVTEVPVDLKDAEGRTAINYFDDRNDKLRCDALIGRLEEKIAQEIRTSSLMATSIFSQVKLLLSQRLAVMLENSQLNRAQRAAAPRPF